MTTPIPRILILGGGYAGLLAAARLSRSKRHLAITLIDQRDRFEQRIRYHEALAGREPATLRYLDWLGRRGVHFCRARIERLDPADQSVTIEQADGVVRSLSYDYLVLTLGSQVAAPVPGAAEHAGRLLSMRGAVQVGAELEALARRRGHLAVVGGGLTALETATEVKERFPDLVVSLICRSSLEAGWSKAGYRHLRQTLDRLGIRVLENRTVVQVVADELVCADGECIAIDGCIWAAGFRPSPLATEAGLPTDDVGRVLTDEYLRVSGHGRLFVAGDLARVYGGRDGQLRMGCVTALPQGAQAGDNLRRLLNGQLMNPFRFGHFFRCVSLGRREGLIQYIDSDDRPLERINRGRLAVWIKEGICRMTFVILKWELKTGRSLYTWPRPKPGTQAPRRTSSSEPSP